MAYGLKYQSVFYNSPPFESKVDVQISKRDYAGGVTQVRTQKVTIDCNFQDKNTAVIGTGAKVDIVFDADQMTQYEDLLTSLEKEFKCVILYNDNIVFDGFSMCDLNERQFLPFAIVTCQFTDYLRRLNGIYLPSLAAANKPTLLSTIVTEALTAIENSTTLYINSSLFSENMTQGEYDEFLSQSYVNNYIFHDSDTQYDDAYDTLNKALLSFGAYLYSYRGMWYLERQEDVLRDVGWLRAVGLASPLTPDDSESQTQILHKQDGDFHYVDMTQVVAYESGLKTLILKLQDKQLDSFIFNDWVIDDMIAISDTFPDPGSIDIGQWYYHENAILTNVGFDYRDLGVYIKWMYPVGSTFEYMELAGLTNAFEIQFPNTTEEPVILTVEYKQSAGEAMLPVGAYARMRFMLRIEGGPLDGNYMSMVDGLMAILPENVEGPHASEVEILIEKNTKPVFPVSVSFNLTDIIFILMEDPILLINMVESRVWSLLGNPAKQKFIITFLPMEWYAPTPEVWAVPSTQYLGDIQMAINTQKILNKLTYYINADFINEDELDLDFFDLDNINFVNGPMTFDGTNYIKTNLWTSILNGTGVPLTDVFAKNRFQNYARTIHRLTGTIMHDGPIKPFAVITDDNLKITDPTAADYNQNVNLIVQSFSWDLFLGQFTIDTQEYTDEDLGFDLTQDTSGNGVNLIAPTNLDGTQVVAGEGFDISWDAVTGAIGYIVQRMPYYDGIAWVMNGWKTVWEGAQTNTYDPIQLEAVPSNGMSFFYRVAAKTNALIGPYTTQLHLFWSSF